MIKVIAFDVGHTLVEYKNPLNWSGLYRKALEKAASDCDIDLDERMVEDAVIILTKYNTRVNYREVEVTGTSIFNEINNSWNGLISDIHAVKSAFYSFFQADACPFPEVCDTLRTLKIQGIKTAVLTDVAYGMDDEFSLKDIEEFSEFIDLALTSVEVGYRKPNRAGFLKIIEHFRIIPEEMMYVGDEEKDIIGANSVGAVSVLINRGSDNKEYGQKYTIKALDEVLTCQVYQ